MATSTSSSSALLCFSSILCFLPLISSTSIPLSHFYKTTPPNQYQYLNNLVSSSLTRAHHLKSSKIAPTSTTTQVFSHSYGGYSISLSFGTPPQPTSLLLDTGSDFLWFPCTERYICNNCSSSYSNRQKFPIFVPKLSSSSSILGCLNPKCAWVHHSNPQCKDCQPNSKNCTQICPPYLILYGSGSTGGIALSESLHLPKRTVPSFLVGCSVFSSRQPAGIAGFGRGPASLPSQLGLRKFSYCLLSHRFDDTAKSSSLVLDEGESSGEKTTGVNYTPFVKNPKITGKPAFSVYYYVGLRKISVGGRSVKVPFKYLKPEVSDGNGGTIIDSGTTFTFMAREVFEAVAKEIQEQVVIYRRAREVELLSGLRPCFNISDSTKKTLSFPQLTFHFKGGAELALPLENYFATVGGGTNDIACLTLVTDELAEREASSGPAIILGNFQLQNFYVEYDLRNERLGFRQQSCN